MMVEQVLLAFLDEAKAAMKFHRARGGNGNIEATLAAHKVAWLMEILAAVRERGSG